jgi:FtsP/CotA-like multicopper oxidase with cupredoxin domain
MIFVISKARAPASRSPRAEAWAIPRRTMARTTRCGSWWLLAATSLAACGTPEAPKDQPAGWDADVALARPKDLSPDPHVLEIDLVAEESAVSIVNVGPTQAWTYNGTIPGPLLELTRGDRLIVHFKNQLPEATTIHWHGLRIPNQMDGMPGYSQPEIPPGGTFDYDFVVPDAGLFWYHPHVESAKGLAYGLYGAIWVKPAPGDPEPMPGALGDDDGSLQDPFTGGDLGTLFGREGNTILVNGHPHPSLNVRSGHRLRLHMVNAARSRYFALTLPGHQFTVIGTDGGLLASPVAQDQLLLVPGQRLDVLVTPKGEPNDGVTLLWVPYDRGFGTASFRTDADVLRIFFADRAEGEPAYVTPPLPTLSRAIDPVDTSTATPVSLQLTQSKDAMGKLVLGINGVPFPDAPPLVASVGETQVWTVTNTMQWNHPFHLHGFFFQALGDDGTPEAPLAWRDTLDIPVNGQRKLAVRFDNRPGMWMFHCHILDHAEAGMAGMLSVVNP